MDENAPKGKLWPPVLLMALMLAFGTLIYIISMS